MTEKKGTIITFELDPLNPHVPDAEEIARYNAIADEDIDYSDIPELDEQWFANAVKHGRDYWYDKRPVTVLVAPEVLAIFEAQGEDADYLMCEALRLYAERLKFGPSIDADKNSTVR